MAISTHLSVITLNVKRLNASVKRHRVPDWTKTKTKPFNMLFTRDSLQAERHRLKLRIWKKTFHVSGSRGSKTILDQTDFKTKTLTKDT